MSYFTLEENLMVESPPQKVNPRHSGKPHSDEAKMAISNSQKLRYKKMKEAALNNISEQRFKEIIKETIDEYFARNITPVNNNNRTNIPI